MGPQALTVPSGMGLPHRSSPLSLPLVIFPLSKGNGHMAHCFCESGGPLFSLLTPESPQGMCSLGTSALQLLHSLPLCIIPASLQGSAYPDLLKNDPQNRAGLEAFHFPAPFSMCSKRHQSAPPPSVVLVLMCYKTVGRAFWMCAPLSTFIQYISNCSMYDPLLFCLPLRILSFHGVSQHPKSECAS